jgi:hypothetical protein
MLQAKERNKATMTTCHDQYPNFRYESQFNNEINLSLTKSLYTVKDSHRLCRLGLLQIHATNKSIPPTAP